MTPHALEFVVDGMTCAHCLRAVEQAIAELPGVNDVRVDLKSGRAVIEGDCSEEAVVRALQNEGYEARVVHPEDQKV